MTPLNLAVFIKFLVGIFLLQGATALLLVTAQDASLARNGWLLGLLGLLIGVIAALWVTSITGHASQHTLLRASEKYQRQRDRIMRALHDLVHAMEGSVSAEHGIGRLKRDDLIRYGDPAKLAAMRVVKQALDPIGIMNPGAIFAP